MADETKARIESELEVKAYIQNLKYALNNGAKIEFQVKRHSLRRCFHIGKIRGCFHGDENCKKRKAFMHMLYGRA